MGVRPGGGGGGGGEGVLLPHSSRQVHCLLVAGGGEGSSSTLYCSLGGGGGGGGEEEQQQQQQQLEGQEGALHSASAVDVLYSVAQGLEDLLALPPALPTCSASASSPASSSSSAPTAAASSTSATSTTTTSLAPLLRAFCPALCRLQRAVDDAAPPSPADSAAALASLGSLLRLPSLAYDTQQQQQQQQQGSSQQQEQQQQQEEEEEQLLAGRGVPGCPLTFSDTQRLTLTPLAGFRRGQVVAWAPPLHTEAATGAASASASGAAAQRPVYAVVLGVGASPWEGAVRLVLGVGAAAAAPVTAMSTSVLCFKGASVLAAAGEGGGGRQGSGGGEEEQESEQEAQQRAASRAAAAAAAAASAAAPSATATTPAAAAAPLPTGLVSEAETVAALNSLLARLSLPPLTGAAGAGLADTLGLRAQRDGAVKEAAGLKREVSTLKAANESLRSAWTCPICFAREVDTALSPCGHTICAACLSSLPGQPMPACPFDRRPVTGAVRLFKPA